MACFNWVDDAISNHTAIITCLFVVLAVIYLAKSSSSKANANLPPGPRGLPVVGYLPFLGTTDLHKTFTELAGVYGPVFKLWLGSKLYVVVSSPSLIKQVVRDQDTIFANRDPPIAAVVANYGCNDIAWSNYGPDWKKLRKLFVSKMMSKPSLDACYGLRRQQVRNSIREIYVNNKGDAMDIAEWSVSTLVRVVQNMLWGKALEFGENNNNNNNNNNKGITNLGVELRLKLEELMVLFGTPNISDIFPVLSWLDLQGIVGRTKKIRGWLANVIDSTVEQYRNNVYVLKGEETAGTSKDFLQLLLELQENEDPASSITRTQFKGVLADIITGGTDTTTTMVEWTMAELMQHPQIMKKVQDELARVVGIDTCVEEYHLSELEYLDAVVKETFRLHPALPLLVPRKASQSGSIGGYTIPKDTTIFLNVWAIHRDPLIWNIPLEFRPERFLNDGSKFDYSGNNFEYIPFGSGRRMCAGIALAQRMLIFVLASLLHSFDWKLPGHTKLDLSEKYGIVIKKKEPLLAVPKPRLPNSELYM